MEEEARMATLDDVTTQVKDLRARLAEMRGYL